MSLNLVICRLVVRLFSFTPSFSSVLSPSSPSPFVSISIPVNFTVPDFVISPRLVWFIYFVSFSGFVYNSMCLGVNVIRICESEYALS